MAGRSLQQLLGGDGGLFVVAIDFGTTHSGFAYLQKSDVQQKVLKFSEWKDRDEGRDYCKTLTALYYESDSRGCNYALVDWGWGALQKCTAAVSRSTAAGMRGVYRYGVTNFKLPGRDNRWACYVEQFKLDLVENKPSSEKLRLPRGLTTERLIVDYLRSLGDQVMVELQSRFSIQAGKEVIEWCLTVPSIWGERAKQVMKVCAEKAGLVQGAACPTPSLASPYPLHLILEPEGAAIYWHEQRKGKVQLCKGARMLIADIGGGTIDLAVHIKSEDDSKGSAVKEVVASYGEPGGGTCVDAAFFDLLEEKIRCFRSFCRREPAAQLSINKEWQRIKTTFQGDESAFAACLRLPRSLIKAWRKHDRKLYEEHMRGANQGQVEDDHEDEHSQLVLKGEDFRRIFNPEVEKVVGLIKQQVGGVDVLLMVGGFASSGYLQKRIVEEFKKSVKQIVVPAGLGAGAFIICQGAVQLYRQPENIQSRIYRKTYGLDVSRPVMSGDPEKYIYQNDDGEKRCKLVFDVFVLSGESVPRNKSVRKIYMPGTHGQKTMMLRLYSSTLSDRLKVPRFVTDEGCKLEGSFMINIEAGIELDKRRRVKVTMVFGASVITLSAVGKNFGNGSLLDQRQFPIQFV